MGFDDTEDECKEFLSVLSVLNGTEIPSQPFLINRFGDKRPFTLENSRGVPCVLLRSMMAIPRKVARMYRFDVTNPDGDSSEFACPTLLLSHGPNAMGYRDT